LIRAGKTCGIAIGEEDKEAVGGEEIGKLFISKEFKSRKHRIPERGG
jgi:hypothetical protein